MPDSHGRTLRPVTVPTASELQAAYDAGEADAEAGNPVTACPYTDVLRRHAYVNGHLAGRGHNRGHNSTGTPSQPVPPAPARP